jgi:glutathione S-transferase
MSALVTVFGAGYSVYVRSVRLALAEKGIDYQLEEVDVFAPDGPPPAHLLRQPFARTPAFEYRMPQLGCG